MAGDRREFSLGAGVDGAVDRLLVVFGDQLDAEAGALRALDPETDAVLMMEVEAASRDPVSHVQRTVQFLAAMRHFAMDLDDAGWRVRYVPLNEAHNTQTFEGEIGRAIGLLSPREVHATRPGSWAAMRALRGACESSGVPLTLHEDEHFLSTPTEFEDWARGRKELILEHFYRRQRKRLGILIDDDGGPVGGEWNFDAENRQTFKAAPDAPPPPRFEPDPITREVIELVGRRLPDLPGSAAGFSWPVTRTQALEALRDFIDNRLPRFGDYQDAMWSGEVSLYHSLLSPSINLKLLNPREVVEAALGAFENGDAPVNSVEGFVRQIIGWREFIRGVYWLEGEGYGQRNELEHDGELPEFYWTGQTDMACMADAVGKVLDHAYSHHIERLMILGNFALLAGVRPRAIDDWFIGMYADAVEWVTTPNVVGMAMHADGGVVGTKPYAASANYINKMSNHCQGCKYDRKARTGEDACPFNTLYWDFLIRNHERFKANRRMALILKNVERMPEDERVEITAAGRRLRGRLGVSG